MGRRRSFDESAVIDAAIAVFSERGHAGTDVGVVCDRAGIGRSSFYHAFDSLDAVFLRALDGYAATGRPVREGMLADPAPAPVVILRRLDGELARQCADADRVGCLSVNTAAELGRSIPAVSEILDADRGEWREVYRALVERGRREGDLREELDPAVHAGLIHSVLAGLRIAARVGEPDDVRAQAYGFVDQLCTPAGSATLHRHAVGASPEHRTEG